MLTLILACDLDSERVNVFHPNATLAFLCSYFQHFLDDCVLFHFRDKKHTALQHIKDVLPSCFLILYLSYSETNYITMSVSYAVVDADIIGLR